MKRKFQTVKVSILQVFYSNKRIREQKTPKDNREVHWVVIFKKEKHEQVLISIKLIKMVDTVSIEIKERNTKFKKKICEFWKYSIKKGQQ